MGNEHFIKHLEFIQAVINRMANTSFLLKGWSITIIAGLFAFSAQENEVALLWLALVLTLVFWFLDSYFLWQERLFRSLYDEVRSHPKVETDLSLDTRRFFSAHPWQNAPFSLTVLPFYLCVVVTLAVFIYKLSN